MNRAELLDKVRNCTPQLGWDDKFPNLYGKYGMTISGICDGWHWFEEDNITEYLRQKGHLPLTDATDIELFEMWALADNYWLNKYKEWLKQSEEKFVRSNRFKIKLCNRDGTVEYCFNQETLNEVLAPFYNKEDNGEI